MRVIYLDPKGCKPEWIDWNINFLKTKKEHIRATLLRYSIWHRSRILSSTFPRFLAPLNVPSYFSAPYKMITVSSAKIFLWKDCKIRVWWKPAVSAHNVLLFRYWGHSGKLSAGVLLSYPLRFTTIEWHWEMRTCCVKTWLLQQQWPLSGGNYIEDILEWATVENEG
jgi:hypothetical protein